jgi:hypothetical protein
MLRYIPTTTNQQLIYVSYFVNPLYFPFLSPNCQNALRRKNRPKNEKHFETNIPRSYGGTYVLSRYFNTYSTVHSLTVYSLLVATVQNNSLNTQHFNKNYNMKVAAALSFLLSSAAFSQCLSFSISPLSHKEKMNLPSSCTSLSNQAGDWNGEVVSNTDGGRIRGCEITQVEGSMTEWTISIDGQEANLGKFSEAIYRKITSDAKREQFQGFRPGTIPPHLISAYIGFSIDECAREATLESMQQNNIRPFEDARNEFEFDSVSIMPPPRKSKKKKKKKKGPIAEEAPAPEEPAEPQWLKFDTLKEACTAGWKVSEI